MNIQWFPGHMAKTRKMISENLKLVDVVIELADARIPSSSRNPEINKIVGNKQKLLVLNKADMADPAISEKWRSYYNRIGEKNIFVDSISGTNLNLVKKTLKEMMQPVFERDLSKGRVFRPIRIMVVGIPNVGKSTFINKLSGRAIAQTGDRPGVTRSKQWVRISGDIELLDTPGVLWPKFDDDATALNLAFTGAIKDEIMDMEELALKFIEIIINSYAEPFKERYKLSDNIEEKTPLEILDECALKRGCLIKGGEIDYSRIAVILLDEFRGCKIGKVTLESPMENKNEEV